MAFVPIVLIFMHLAYAAAAHPFGVLADHIDHRRQLVMGAAVLVAADLILANATEAWMAVVGAGFWGLQLAVTLPMQLRKGCGVQFSVSTIWLSVMRPSWQALRSAHYGQLSDPAPLSASAVW